MLSSCKLRSIFSSDMRAGRPARKNSPFSMRRGASGSLAFLSPGFLSPGLPGAGDLPRATDLSSAASARSSATSAPSSVLLDEMRLAVSEPPPPSADSGTALRPAGAEMTRESSRRRTAAPS